MKRILFALGLTGLAIGAGHLVAQQPLAPQAVAPQGVAAQGMPGLRVATVNVGLVFTKYAKAAKFKADMETLLAPHRAEGAKLKKEIIDWSEAMRNPSFPAKDKERYESGIRNNQRQLEDLELRVRKVIGSTQEEQIITLYREVSEAVKACAQANGIHVVLGYGEQIEGDVFSFVNINRKMQGMDLSSCNPLYVAQGVDISQQVADNLNFAFQRAGGVTPVSGTAPGGMLPASVPSTK